MTAYRAHPVHQAVPGVAERARLHAAGLRLLPGRPDRPDARMTPPRSAIAERSERRPKAPWSDSDPQRIPGRQRPSELAPRHAAAAGTPSRSRYRVLAPGMAMLLNVSGVAAVSGGSTPLAFLLGGIACLALAFVVIGFTRRMASAGYAYTYASRSLGKERRLHGRLALLLRHDLLRPDDHVRRRLPGGRPARRRDPKLVDPVLLHRDGAVPGAVGDQDQGHHPGAAVRRHRHRGGHPDRRPGHDRQGRQPRAGAVGVHLRPLAPRRLQRRVLRDHPRASPPTSASRPRPTSARRPPTRAATSRSR